MVEKTNRRHVTIAGRGFDLTNRGVARALRGVEPEPIASHYVVIEGRRFPPKQIISHVTGLDRADFTSHQARRTLLRLGFPAGRRTRAAGTARAPPSAAAPEGLADRLRPLAGQWVAIRDDDVLHAAGTPHELVGWLARHGQTAQSMFRVPEDDVAASGLAPL
jgi:hypothetical protein